VTRGSWLPLLLLALALALRLPGLDALLPHHAEPDDHAVRQAQRLRGGDPGADPWSWGKYGHLVARLLWLMPAPATDAPLDAEHLDEHLRLAGADHLRARWISALLAALAVPATFCLARRWLTPGWSALAALLLATSLLHLALSTQARPHAPFTTLALLAVLAALRVRRDPGPRAAALLAGAVFLAAGTLHTAACLLPACLAALALREPGRARPGVVARAAPFLAAAAALPVFWPFLFERSAPLQLAGREVDPAFPHLLEAGMFDGRGLRTWLDALRGYDPVLLAAACLGAATSLARLVRWRPESAAARRDAAVALAFALPCALAFGLSGRSFERFFLPLHPFLALLAACGLRDAVLPLSRASPALRTGMALLLAGGVLGLPAFAAVRLAWLRTRPDTLELAARALDDLDPRRAQAVLLDPRASLPLAGPLPAGADPGSSQWLRYLIERQVAERSVAGRPLVPFPADLARRLRKRTSRAEASALLDQVSGLGCTWLLDVEPDGSEPDEVPAAVLAQRATRCWRVPGPGDAPWAEVGYQESDMLHVVLGAPAWGPKVSLWRLQDGP
jgi:hypothetical protein